MTFIKLFGSKFDILEQSLSKRVDEDSNAIVIKTILDWKRANIKINNSLIHNKDLDSKAIEGAVSKLKTHSVIQEYICKLSHQDGFLTAGENYTTYSC